MKKIIIALTILCLSLGVQARQYKGSFFGMRSDGVTTNTSALQLAIDYISTQSPGDTLAIWVGRYPIGTVYMRSNVTIHLREGAILTGIKTAWEYDNFGGTPTMIAGEGVENFHIYGKGVIEGFGDQVKAQIDKQVEKGFIKAAADAMPYQIVLKNCKNIDIQGIVLQNGVAGSLLAEGCSNLNVDGITIFGHAVEGSTGIIVNSCNGVMLLNNYIDTKATPLMGKNNVNVKIENCIRPDGAQLTL